MNRHYEEMKEGRNPFVATRRNRDTEELEPTYELKYGLVLYTDYAPGPIRARAVSDRYFAHFGDRIRRWTSTTEGEADLTEWDVASRSLFENERIPHLRKGIHWGYAFDDGNEFDTWLFMLHGYRPASEPGRAGFFRFEFPWNVEQSVVRNFAAELLDVAPFTSGFAGYFFKPAVDEPDSYDTMYAVCRRFWGIEAWNLDVSVCYLKQAYLSVNWLTLIGAELGRLIPEGMEEAKRHAVDAIDGKYGTILQASDVATLGDRNAGEPMDAYFAIARALMPIQVTTFESFGGRRWNDDNSFAWVRRFNTLDSRWGRSPSD